MVDAGLDLLAYEGDAVAFTATYTDEDITENDPVTILWDFGDGATASDTLAPTHAYGDDGVYEVTLTITDSLGSVGIDTLEVVVSNVAPAAAPIPSRTLLIETPLTVTLTFTDPGWLDTHQVVVDWGDGDTDTLNLLAGVLTTDLTHTYLTAADYVVLVTIQDDDGGEDTLQFTLWVLAEYYRIRMPLVVK